MSSGGWIESSDGLDVVQKIKNSSILEKLIYISRSIFLKNQYSFSFGLHHFPNLKSH